MTFRDTSIASYFHAISVCIIILAIPLSIMSQRPTVSPASKQPKQQDVSNKGNVDNTSENKGSPIPTSSPSPSPTTLLGDSSVLAGTIQAIAAVVAAVIAVLIGFLLSTLAERRAWKRRKVEQLREKQLTALLAFLSDIHKFVELSQSILIELKLSSESLPKLEEGKVGRTAVLEATIKTQKAQAANWLKEMDDYRRNTLLRITELTFLRIREKGLQLSTECHKYIASLIEVLKGIYSSPPTKTATDFEGTLQDLILKSDELIQSAIDSIHD